MPSTEQYGGFVLFQQDWRGHQFGDRKPPVLRTWFGSRSEAEENKSKLRLRYPDPDMTLLCVVPAPAPRKAKRARR